MVSYKDVKNIMGRVQPVAWITIVAGLSLIIAINQTFTSLYTSLDTIKQLIVIIVLVIIVSITGYKTVTLEGLLKPKSRGKKK